MGWDVDDPALLRLDTSGNTANHGPCFPVQRCRSKAGEEDRVATLNTPQHTLGVGDANGVRDERILEERVLG